MSSHQLISREQMVQRLFYVQDPLIHLFVIVVAAIVDIISYK